MKVVVVGGGVAGTVSALALRRLGAQVEIVEAYPDPAGSVGSFLSLATNALRGLAAVDCLERVSARGFPVARQLMWAGSGRLLGDVPRGRLPADPLRSITLMRADLVDELRRAVCEAGVPITTGERLVGAETRGDGVRARFASGATLDADLLVGADGIWSTTRGIVAPATPAPSYAGLYTVSGVSRADAGDLPPGDLSAGDLSAGDLPGGGAGVQAAGGSAFNMVLAGNGAFIHLRAPNGDVWWQAQVNSAAEPDRDGVTDREWLRRLGELYRAEAVPAAVIGATTQLWPVTVNHVLGPVPNWHDGRIVLVGDAAHPIGAGQGAAMAIESGLALAAELRAATSIPAALAGYEARRRPRATRMLKMARENRGIKQSGGLQRRMEELVMPIFFRYFFVRATAWLYADQPEAAAL